MHFRKFLRREESLTETLQFQLRVEDLTKSADPGPEHWITIAIPMECEASPFMAVARGILIGGHAQICFGEQLEYNRVPLTLKRVTCRAIPFVRHRLLRLAKRRLKPNEGQST